MEALTSLESLLVAGLVPAALVLALWSARKGLSGGPEAAKTGESVWSFVAIAVLASVSAAVHVGIGHGF